MSNLSTDTDPTPVRSAASDTATATQWPIEYRPLAVRSFGLTDPGRVRTANEDQFLIAMLTKAMRVQQSSLRQSKEQYSDEQAYIFLVADGMGGVKGGEQASTLAVESLESFMLNTLKWFFHLRGAEAKDVLSEFQAALSQANERVMREAMMHPDLRGMGTTLTMAYNLDAELFVVHVGDSRCYLCRGGTLHRLTHDHTLVQQMVNQGQLQPEQAAQHRLRHVITNVVGGQDPEVQVEVHKVRLEAGDVVLLCTDGLTEMVDDEQITAILQAETEPRSACERLVAQANEKGGKDNVTVVVARYEAVAIRRGAGTS